MDTQRVDTQRKLSALAPRSRCLARIRRPPRKDPRVSTWQDRSRNVAASDPKNVPLGVGAIEISGLTGP